MATPDRCPACAATLPPDAPAGLCPRCLMGRALHEPGTGSAGVALGCEPSRPGHVLETLAAAIGPLPRVLLPDTGPDDTAALVQPGSAEMPPPSDRSGRYQLFGEIARGGMGAILRGRDPDLGRELAVKVLLEGHKGKPELVRRFVDEAQIGGQLQHPGIVPVYELGTFADSRPYFTMKLVKGRTLAEVLAARPDPSHDRHRLVGVFLQVAQTVAYAHARGVVHRDLKPSNVMVGSFGEVQVMDWGLAKVLPRGGLAADASAGVEPPAHETVIATARSAADSDLSSAGSILGTPPYMPPEQALGEIDRIDERADVFALGAILCEILTGKPPYVGRTAVETLGKAKRTDLADAHARLASCGADPELIALAGRCLAPEPLDRLHDAGAVVEAVAAYVADVQNRLHRAEIARAEETARAEEATKRAAVERSRRRVTLALAASVLATAGLGTSGWILMEEGRRTRQVAVRAALAEAQSLLERAIAGTRDQPGRWAEALAAAKQAEGLLARDDDPDLRRKVTASRGQIESAKRAADADRELLARLVEIRSSRKDHAHKATDDAYFDAFRDAGIDLRTLESADAAELLRRKPLAVVAEIATFLDDLSLMHLDNHPEGSGDSGHRFNPNVMARLIDPDAFRNQLRATLDDGPIAGQAGQLKEFAADSRAATLPAATSTLFAAMLQASGETQQAIRLLRDAVARHPGDFWANYTLATHLDELQPPQREEAVRFYTAARTIRPTASHQLAHVLERLDRKDEAEAIFRDLMARAPEGARHLMCLYNLLEERGKAEEARVVGDQAIAAARAAIRRNPEAHEPHLIISATLKGQGDIGGSIAAARETLRLNPNDAFRSSWLGGLLSKTGEIEGAIAAYRDAVKFEPSQPSYHHDLGAALRRKGDLDGAVAEFREAIRLDPDDANSRNDLGAILCDKKGEYDAALAEFREALRIDPSDAHIYVNIAVASGKKGDREGAIAAYREVIRLEADDPEIYLTLGRVLYEAGDIDGAVAACREAVRLKPDNASSQMSLSAFLVDGKGDVEGGMDAAREAIRLDPGMAEAHVNLGGAFHHLGRYDEAIEEWREAIRLNPQLFQAHHNLAKYLSKIKQDHDGASAIYREYVRLNPDHVEAYRELGSVLENRRGDHDGAVAAFREAIRRKPDDALSHEYLGVTLLHQGDAGGAASEFRETIRLQPDRAYAHYGLGLALSESGNPEGAMKAYRESIRLDPDHAESHCNLGHVLRRQGRYVEARDELRRGHELGSKRADWGYASEEWVRDCERLVGLADRLMPVIRGDDRPRDIGEALAIAQVAYDTKRHSAAARLWGDALAEDPKLADDRQTRHRYSAACAAALAGCGRGEDDPPPDEAARAGLRRQARDWLGAERSAWAAVLDSGKPEDRRTVAKTLRHWQADPDLAGVRDPEALEKLPEEERAAWRALWAEVEALLKKAG